MTVRGLRVFLSASPGVARYLEVEARVIDLRLAGDSTPLIEDWYAGQLFDAWEDLTADERDELRHLPPQLVM